MKFRIMALEAFALFVSYLVFSLTLVSATDVNIMYNGQIQDTAKYEHDKLVNMNIAINHEPSDITWTNIKLTVNLNSASLSHSIKKIFLYKCRSATPTECVRSTPQSFDNYVDTELLWKDVSEKTGSSQYPQAGNLLFIVKLEDTNKKESWAGFFTYVKRTNYNIFDVKQLSLGSIDLYAKSLDLVQPIKAYIENKFMIPFKWASRVVFNNAQPLYGMGADSQELESHNLQTAVVPSNEITSINKEFYFVAPNISSGIANPITLNLNPSFNCGNGICESDIGETMSSCCYDCGCPTGQFCDVPANINLSSCRNDTSTLSIITASTPPITDCSKGFTANISVRVANPPVSLGSPIQGTVTLNSTMYNTQCSGGSGSYECSIPITSQIKCGGGSYIISPGTINLTLSYKDGSNTVTKTLSASFSGVTVTYDCKCQEGTYCDSIKKTCQSEAAITLGITRLTSYLENYHPGDRINLTAKIFNPPAGVVLVDKSATMNLTNGQVSPGTPDCSAPNSQYEYNCLIPFQIVNYQNTNSYTFNPNTLYFTITYNDGPLAKTKTISAPFGPVSIPSKSCGDGQCNMDETQDTCCLDCGCPGTGKYCDKVNGCRDLSSVTLSVSSVYPTNFTDCRESHTVYLGVTVNNAPTDLALDYSAYMQAGVIKGWNFQCQKSSPSMLNCTLVIPPLEAEGCPLPFKVISQNAINMSISFPDGKSKQVTKTLSAPFSDIYVTPVYHCGDGTCESNIGEDASVCCYDCKCKDSPDFGSEYFCDFDQKTSLGGCLPKNNITLVIDSPRTPVNLDTCELTNNLNIQAHIINQPTNAMPTLYYATINGTSSQSVFCNSNQLGQGGANLTFNCTLSLPRIYQCSQGKTYTFDPNSFSILISYQNGAQQTETQTLSAGLPTITIKQGIRTLYDITNEGIQKMQDKLKQTMNTAQDMLDAFKSCMKMVETISYITLLASVATIGLGTFGGGGKVIPSTDFSTAIKNGLGVAQAGAAIMQAYGNMCNYYNTMYQLDLKVQQIEMNMIQMDMCMQQQQHIMDIGSCDQNPQSCFSGMVSCVNFANLNSVASDLTSILNNGNSILNQMNTNLNTAANNLGFVGGNNNAIVYATCGSSLTAQPNCCSEVSGSSGLVTTCPSQNSFLRVQTTSGSCQYPVVTNTCGIVGNFEYLACRGSTCTSGYQLPLPSTAGGKDTYQFKLYCFTSENSFTSAVGSNPVPGTSIDASKISSYKSTSNEWAFVYARGSGSTPTKSEDKCKCTDLTPSAQCVTTGTTGETGCCVKSDKTCTDNTANSGCARFEKNKKCSDLSDYSNVCSAGTTPENKAPQISSFDAQQISANCEVVGDVVVCSSIKIKFTVTANDEDGMINSYTLYCGNGGQTFGTPFAKNVNIEETCTYDTAGAYTAKIVLVDDKGKSAEDPKIITLPMT